MLKSATLSRWLNLVLTSVLPYRPVMIKLDGKSRHTDCCGFNGGWLRDGSRGLPALERGRLVGCVRSLSGGVENLAKLAARSGGIRGENTE